ncbi:MAG: hypothetical protein R6X14_03930 [bacterium]
MNVKRFVTAAGVLTLLACTDVAPLPPEIVEHPAEAYQSQPVGFRVTSRSPDGRPVVFIADWGDGRTDTSAVSGSGDTATMRHAWTAPGGHEVSFRAASAGRTDETSDWSAPVTMTVRANGVPAVPTLRLPERALPDAWTLFRAHARDPDLDSVQYLFDYGGTVGAWTGFTDGGVSGWALDSHRFGRTGLVPVRAKARDWKGSESDWSPSETLVVGETGAVRWSYRPERRIAYDGTPLVVFAGGEELVIVSGRDLHAIGASHRILPGPPGAEFSPYPAWNEQVGHLIVGRSDGAFSAYTPGLVEVWSVRPETTGRWSAPVIAGSRVYATWDYFRGIRPHNEGRLWCFEDRGTGVEVIASFDSVTVLSPPVATSAGNVIVGRASTIACLTPDLDSVIWETRVSDGHSVYALAVDGADRVYYSAPVDYTRCVVGALGPDGSPLWTHDSRLAYGIAVGRDAIYCATDITTACLEFDGTERWTTWDEEAQMDCTPALAANGLLYLVSPESEAVHCLGQDDGVERWRCVLSDHPAGRDDMPRIQPTLTSRGDIIVAYYDGIFCIAGYRDGPLDPAAPWPKWQRDAHNTGRAR